MIPHERSLVKLHAKEPFVLIGVNSDPDKDWVLARNAKTGVTWRSFWNGPNGISGPISDAWRVAEWPTVYLIDHEGLIRNKWVGSPGADVLSGAVAELLRDVK